MGGEGASRGGDGWRGLRGIRDPPPFPSPGCSEFAQPQPCRAESQCSWGLPRYALGIQTPLPAPQHHCGEGTAIWGQPCHPTNGGSQGSRTPGSRGTVQAPNAAVGWDGDEAATPTYPARLRVAAAPRGVLYGASAALCPPRPRCRVSRCSQAHGHRPAADVFPSSRLLPPRMGSGPNPALGTNLCPHHTMGAQDGTLGSHSTFTPRGLGLKHRLDHSRGAGHVPSPKCISFSALPRRGWGCTRDGNVVPIAVPTTVPIVPRCRSSSRLQSQGWAHPAPSESCDSATR